MGDIIEVRVGQERLLVETIPVSGSELTSAKLHRPPDHVLDAFDRTKDAIIEVATSAKQVIKETAARAARPDRLEIEFGIGFTVKGDVIVAGAACNASLVVRLVYDTSDQDGGVSGQ